jgi:hypothetical protein
MQRINVYAACVTAFIDKTLKYNLVTGKTGEMAVENSTQHSKQSFCSGRI